jgi:hypothetical protein
MNKKLFIKLAPLLAIAAAVMPAAAQATEPHWTSNGVRLENANPWVDGWGTISLVTVKGGTPGSYVTCRIALVFTAYNAGPGAGGPAGTGRVAVIIPATHPCESEGMCPAGTEAVVTPMGGTVPYYTLWYTVLEGSGSTIRDKMGVAPSRVEIKVSCLKGGTVEGGFTLVGQLAPRCMHGTSATHPGFLEFDAGSGELEVEGSAGTVTVRAEGELKMIGEAESELINCRNP